MSCKFASCDFKLRKINSTFCYRFSIRNILTRISILIIEDRTEISFFLRNWIAVKRHEKRGELERLRKRCFLRSFYSSSSETLFLNGAQNWKSLERRCHLTHTASFIQRNVESAILWIIEFPVFSGKILQLCKCVHSLIVRYFQFLQITKSCIANELLNLYRASILFIQKSRISSRAKMAKNRE